MPRMTTAKFEICEGDYVRVKEPKDYLGGCEFGIVHEIHGADIFGFRVGLVLIDADGEVYQLDEFRGSKKPTIVDFVETELEIVVPGGKGIGSDGRPRRQSAIEFNRKRFSVGGLLGREFDAELCDIPV